MGNVPCNPLPQPTSSLHTISASPSPHAQQLQRACAYLALSPAQRFRSGRLASASQTTFRVPTLCTCADRGVCPSPWQQALGARVSVEGSAGAAYSIPCSVIVNASGVWSVQVADGFTEASCPCDKGGNNIGKIDCLNTK